MISMTPMRARIPWWFSFMSRGCRFVNHLVAASFTDFRAVSRPALCGCGGKACEGGASAHLRD
jgi:hypothetical protein